MSLKDLFGKKSLTVAKAASLSDIGQDVESIDYVQEFLEDKKRFVPDVDFEDPTNFSRYGSAEKYYEDSIKSIYKSYQTIGSSLACVEPSRPFRHDPVKIGEALHR